MIKIKLKKETKINFLLFGKFDKDNEKLYNDILRHYYGLKSVVIPFDNMKKMKSILSSNNIINDNITFPNEVYIQKEKNINFLLVGKFKPENEKEYKSSLLDFFGAKSDIIPFDNMKKIRSILSSNNIIKDDIIFPNEVYK